MSWLKDNKTRISLDIISLLSALLYVFIRSPDFSNMDNPINFSEFGLRWLEAAIIVSLIISAVGFVIARIKGEKKWSELSKTQKPGLFIGFSVYTLLLIIMGFQFTEHALSFNTLTIFIIIIAFIMAIVDFLLNMSIWVIELDIICFVTLLLTFIIVNSYLYNIKESDFLVGFQSGAVAFQLILVNLFFDPKEYFKIF